ncbi:hypothetical protein JR053_04865, partial [Wolbachia endosymbiont of Nasonia vitripennis]|uniref:hypothetical protein n=1 Tax=Wolbachia endosymbiont of Nasonia vitripennis TaxID=180837 RepID=UPI003A8921CE
TDSHFLWHIFSSTVKWLFIMNFVSNCQFFSLERCNKAIPVSRTGMTRGELLGWQEENYWDDKGRATK